MYMEKVRSASQISSAIRLWPEQPKTPLFLLMFFYRRMRSRRLMALGWCQRMHFSPEALYHGRTYEFQIAAKLRFRSNCILNLSRTTDVCL